jgi:hypothetical protein
MRTLDSWDDLRQVIGLVEQPDLDFKEARSRDHFAIEARKDIAALANTLGGHIIIGASTDRNRTRCTGFHGVDAAEATALAGEYEKEAKACRPTPFVSSHCVDHPERAGRVVLVLRVGMSPMAPVGASLQQESGGHLVSDGWCFPYRVGSHTKYLAPDQFGAYESMSARRAAALLTGIPEGERNTLRLEWDNDAESQVSLIDVRLDRNVVVLQSSPGRLKGGPSPLQEPVGIPLDQVVTVWREKDGVWVVSVLGKLGARGTYEAARR